MRTTNVIKHKRKKPKGGMTKVRKHKRSLSELEKQMLKSKKSVEIPIEFRNKTKKENEDFLKEKYSKKEMSEIEDFTHTETEYKNKEIDKIIKERLSRGDSIEDLYANAPEINGDYISDDEIYDSYNRVVVEGGFKSSNDLLRTNKSVTVSWEQENYPGDYPATIQMKKDFNSGKEAKEWINQMNKSAKSINRRFDLYSITEKKENNKYKVDDIDVVLEGDEYNRFQKRLSDKFDVKIKKNNDVVRGIDNVSIYGKKENIKKALKSIGAEELEEYIEEEK